MIILMILKSDCYKFMNNGVELFISFYILFFQSELGEPGIDISIKAIKYFFF